MKIEDITPPEYRCAIGACPAVFRTDRDTLVIVGRVLSAAETHGMLPGRISSDEGAIEIPIGLV